MTIVEALAEWRNSDQTDSIVLTRHEVITLLEEIRAVNAELLEALEGIVNNHHNHPYSPYFAKARAAIAKAKGET